MSIPLTISAKEAARIEGIDYRTIVKHIKNGTYPFGRAYGKGNYRVASRPLIEFLGISEAEAITRMKGN